MTLSQEVLGKPNKQHVIYLQFVVYIVYEYGYNKHFPFTYISQRLFILRFVLC